MTMCQECNKRKKVKLEQQHNCADCQSYYKNKKRNIEWKIKIVKSIKSGTHSGRVKWTEIRDMASLARL